MKKSRLQELRSRSFSELVELAKKTRETLAKLRFDLKAGKTDAVKEIRKLRKELAVILTLQNQLRKKHESEKK